MLKKAKTVDKTTLPGAHYVLDWSLEETMEQISRLAEYDVRVFAHPVDDDTVEIDIQKKWTGKITAAAQISLRRWQGTQTRFDARVAASRWYQTWWENGLILLGFGVFIVTMLGAAWGIAEGLAYLIPIAVIVIMATAFGRHSAFMRRWQTQQLSAQLLTDIETHVSAAKIETLWFGRGLRATPPMEAVFEESPDSTKE